MSKMSKMNSKRKNNRTNQNKSSPASNTSLKNIWGRFKTKNNSIVSILIVLFTFATLSAVSNKWYDNTYYSIIFNPIYWVIVASLATISLKKIYKKETINIDIAQTFALMSIVLGIALILVQTANPNFCLKSILKEESISYSQAKEHIVWWQDEIVLAKNESILIGSVKEGDKLKSFSTHGHMIKEEGGYNSLIQGKINMITNFFNFSGYHEVRLSGNNKENTVVRYKIIRG